MIQVSRQKCVLPRPNFCVVSALAGKWELTVVVFRMISGSSRSSGTTSSTNRGTMGGAGGGAKGVMAAFLALEKNLVKNVKHGLIVSFLSKYHISL